MARDVIHSRDDDHIVIGFRPRTNKRGGTPPQFRVKRDKRDGQQTDSLLKSLTDYELERSDDDYRHRMMINGIVLLVNIVLISVGVWLALNIPR